jgi:hypothetical protein
VIYVIYNTVISAKAIVIYEIGNYPITTIISAINNNHIWKKTKKHLNKYKITVSYLQWTTVISKLNCSHICNICISHKNSHTKTDNQYCFVSIQLNPTEMYNVFDKYNKHVQYLNVQKKIYLETILKIYQWPLTNHSKSIDMEIKKQQKTKQHQKTTWHCISMCHFNNNYNNNNNNNNNNIIIMIIILNIIWWYTIQCIIFFNIELKKASLLKRQ